MTEPQLQNEQVGPPPLSHILLVLLAGILLYIPFLGRAGFGATEGHRVIPGWEMLETGNWWLPQMFGQGYLRKPPGMPWAVAVSSMVFGQTEFAARLVSAGATIALALVTTVFAARWFGRRYAIAGGLASLLTPVFWSPARAAEIEALNNFAAATAVFLFLDLLLKPTRGRADFVRVFSYSILLTLALTTAALVKGPAAAPAIAFAIIVPCLLTRSPRPLRAPALWVAVIATTVTLAFIFNRIAQAVEASGQTPVLQGVSDFLWTGRPFTLASVGEVAAMPFLALLSVLPWSLAMLFPWGRDARQEAARSSANAHAFQMAQAITLTALLSILLLALMGVRNPRYAQPCVAFVPILAAYAFRGFHADFVAHRRRIVRILMLGSPAALPSLLAGVALVLIHRGPSADPHFSGRSAGVLLAPYLDDGAEVWADHLIEARPEVLLYAAREAAADSRAVRPRWIPGLAASAALPPPGSYLALRRDAGSDEPGVYVSAGLGARLEPITADHVHRFLFTLYRVLPPGTAAPDPDGNTP